MSNNDAAGLIDYTECVVGQKITFQGETYKVLRNDFLEEENSSSSSLNKNVLSNVAVNVSRAVITTNSNSGSEYKNEKAKNLRWNKVEKDYGVSKFIELFNVTNNNINYVLHAPAGSNFCSFNITSNKIAANGDGTLNDSTSKSVWRGR